MFSLVALLRKGSLSKGSAVVHSSLFLSEGVMLRHMVLGRKTPASPCVRVPAPREVNGLQANLLSGWWGHAQLQRCSAIYRSLAVAQALLPVTQYSGLLVIIITLFFHQPPLIGLSE